LKSFKYEVSSGGKVIIIFRKIVDFRIYNDVSHVLKFSLYGRANIFLGLCDFYPLCSIFNKRITEKRLLWVWVGFWFSSLQIFFVDIQFTLELNDVWLSVSLKERRTDTDELQERKPKLIRSLDEISL